jgi:hypothetical protein
MKLLNRLLRSRKVAWALIAVSLLAGTAWLWFPRAWTDVLQGWANSLGQEYVAYAIDSQTLNLPVVDRVEVLVLAHGEPASPGAATFPAGPAEEPAVIVRTAPVTGAEAEALAAVWRSAGFGGDGAMCHFPVYGLRFYSGGGLVLETSLCWKCSNVTLRVLGFQQYVGFGDMELALADRLQQIVAVDAPVQAAFEDLRGHTHQAYKRRPEAMAAFRKSLQLYPAFHPSRRSLARMLRDNGDLDGAIAEYDNLLRFGAEGEDGQGESYWLETLVQQADVYRRTGETERAFANLEIVEGQEVDEARYRWSGWLLAWQIYTAQGNQEAAEVYRKKLNVEDPAEFLSSP